EEKRECDWKCKLGGGLKSVVDFGKNTVVGVYEGGKDLVVGTWNSITGATCMATGVGCSEEERQKMIDDLVNQWNAFKDNPLQYTKEIAEAAIANCKNAVTGADNGEAFGRCLVDVAGVIVAKKLPPGAKLPGGRRDHDAGGKPDPRNDRDNDGKPDCVLTTALGGPGGRPGGTVAFGRMGLHPPLSLLLAANCPIEDEAKKAQDAAGRAKDAAGKGDITGAEQAARDADKAYQDARKAAEQAGEKNVDGNEAVKKAEQAKKEADQALRDAAKKRIDELRHSGGRPEAHAVERHLDPTDDRLKMRLGKPLYGDPPANTQGVPLQGGPNSGYAKNQPGTKVDPARPNPYNPDGSLNGDDYFRRDAQGNPVDHRAGPFATAFSDPVDLAIADEFARKNVLPSMTPNGNGMYPEFKISLDKLPPGAAKRMRGYYRKVNDPDNPVPIDFDGAELICRYAVDANGKPYLATMFPDPLKSKNPP
ncbi:hypothetical protein ACSNOI_34400, partial [Actinomadura kijaniata]|uniref:hypothetical protein n=1 Tax=Actinomadura kijaniata TaxID=46161 RepID=UPI003F1A4287